MKHLNEGESIEVKGSGKNPYIIKKSGGVISCSCPAWRNQSLSIDQRTCKHIKANVSNGAAASTQSGSVVAAMEAAGATVIPTVTGKGTPKNVPPCLLANSWDGEQDVSGWWVSYKLDGVRAWWDGEKFWSRLGNEYHAPQWFKDAMPKGVVLDGELFAGNGKFSETVSTVKKLVPNDAEWKNIKFMVFDAPEIEGSFENRNLELYKGFFSWSDDQPDDKIRMLKQIKCEKTQDVMRLLKQAEEDGYEGLMLRQPGSMYESGRSQTLLKVKSFKDLEARVIGYEKGKGKHKGRMGALVVMTTDGVKFSVGSGFTDKERESPPEIDTWITVKYQELSKDNVPRFPVYHRKYQAL